MDTGEYEDDFEPPESTLPPLPRYSSLTCNFDFRDGEGSSISGNQDQITSFLNGMLDQSISDLTKEDEVSGKFEKTENPSGYDKEHNKESDVTVSVNVTKDMTEKDLDLYSLKEQTQEKEQPTLVDLEPHTSKGKSSKKKPKLPKDVNAVNIKPGTIFNPVQFEPALMEDSEDLRMDVLIKQFRMAQVMKFIKHADVIRKETTATFPNPSSLSGNSSNDCTETIDGGKLDPSKTTITEGNNVTKDETQAVNKMDRTTESVEIATTSSEAKADDTICKMEQFGSPLNVEELNMKQAKNKESADEERTFKTSRTILDILLRRKTVNKIPQTKLQEQKRLPKLNILNCFKTKEINDDENQDISQTPKAKKKHGLFRRCFAFFEKKSAKVEHSSFGS